MYSDDLIVFSILVAPYGQEMGAVTWNEEEIDASKKINRRKKPHRHLSHKVSIERLNVNHAQSLGRLRSNNAALFALNQRRPSDFGL